MPISPHNTWFLQEDLQNVGDMDFYVALINTCGEVCFNGVEVKVVRVERSTSAHLEAVA